MIWNGTGRPVLQQFVSCRAAGQLAVWGKIKSLGSVKEMRTKLDGWRRKGQLRAAMSAMRVKKQGTHALLTALAVSMLLIMATSVLRLRMHLRDGSASLRGNEGTAKLPGTIDEDEFFQCDRSDIRTDICNLRGDIRLESHNNTKSFVLYTHRPGGNNRTETLKPYTRKWEVSGSMSSVESLTLTSRPAAHPRPKCDVRHQVPAVIFSTAGYTGNLYHEFNDGLIPLWISTQHLHKNVVLIVSSFHDWWYTKYQEVLAEMTKYEIISLEEDTRAHCFPEIEAGLHIHGELAVNPMEMPHMETIRGFRALLNRAYTPGPTRREARRVPPRLTIILRRKTRRFLNLDKLVELAKWLGFRVSLLSPEPDTELKKIYWLLNKTDVLVGVHGAAMTHLLFMRPGTVFIQVVPLGTDWAANEYYGEPAVRMGLRYLPYKIAPAESSLSDQYNATDPVLVDPESITQQGWESLKRIYLEGQDVRVSLQRMGKVLAQARAVVARGQR